MIKFRQKIFIEGSASESDNGSEITYEGGVLAPLLVGGGIGAMSYGSKKLKKAKELEKSVPEIAKQARPINKRGIEEANRVRESWGGLGKYLRKDKIRKINEDTAREVETVMRRARKTSRSAAFNKIKGKAAIGLGALGAGYGAYRLIKDIKRNKKEDK